MILTIMKFQLFSDLHTEMYNGIPKIVPHCDLLILAGDIGNIHLETFEAFFTYVSKNWKHVVYVPGNHEYFSKTPIDKLKKDYLEFLSKYSNIYYLDNDMFIHDRYVIIGSTLWSKPRKTLDLTDFRLIHEEHAKKLTLKTFHQMHNEAVNYIKQTLIKYTRGVKHKIIVVTHFPPVREGTSHPKYDNSYVKDYFTNVLEDLDLKLDNVKLWISGHTHYSYDFTKDGIRFLSNQLGYHDEIKESRVDFNGIFEID